MPDIIRDLVARSTVSVMRGQAALAVDVFLPLAGVADADATYGHNAVATSCATGTDTHASAKSVRISLPLSSLKADWLDTAPDQECSSAASNPEA